MIATRPTGPNEQQTAGEDGPSREIAVWLEEIERAFDDVRDLEDVLREHRREILEHDASAGLGGPSRRNEYKRLEKRHHITMAYWRLLRDALTQK